MPDPIWLDNPSFNQTAGVLWAQQQVQNLGQQVGNGEQWAQQQIGNLVAPSSSSPPAADGASAGPAPESPPAVLPPISPEQQAPTAQALGQQWADQQTQDALNASPPSPPPPPPPATPDQAATPQDLGQQWANQQLSTAATPPPSPGTPPAQPAAVEDQRQFENAAGLSTADAYSACGPVAATAFAQSYGRNPTPSEAMQLAQQVGWTGSKGMAGPASEVNLLQQMGVDAHMTQGVNWDDVAQSASSGNPTIIDTPGHYYYVSAYNSDTGQFYVGSSGTALKGGSEWMTPQQMGNVPAAKGAPDAAIFANHPLNAAQAAPTSPTAPVTAPLSLSQGVPPGPQAQQPGDLIDQARQIAQNAGIDPDIFTRQIQQESGFQPFNADGSPKTSPAGAVGIAQFMPDTARGLGIDPTDPIQSLTAAAEMDAQNLQKYGGDWAQTLAAYNAGPGAVAQYAGVPPFAETQNYVKTILGGAQNVVQQVGQGISSAVQGVQGAAQNEVQNLSQQLLQQGQNALGAVGTGFSNLGTGAQDLLQGTQQTPDLASQLSQQLLQQGQQRLNQVGTGFSNLGTGAQDLSQQLLQQGQQGLSQLGAVSVPDLSPGGIMGAAATLQQQLAAGGTGNLGPLQIGPLPADNAVIPVKLGGIDITQPYSSEAATQALLGQNANPVVQSALNQVLNPVNAFFGPLGVVAGATGGAGSELGREIAQQAGGDARAQAIGSLVGGLAGGLSPMALERTAPAALSRGLGLLDVLSPPEAAYASEIPSQLGLPGMPPSAVSPADQVVQDAVNINLNKYNITPQAQQAIAGMAEAFPENMSAATRGVITDQAASELADRLGTSVSDVFQNWNPGDAQNSETIIAMNRALAAQAQKVVDAQTALRADPTNVDLQTQFMDQLLQQGNIMEPVVGATAEAGRALRAFAQPVDPTTQAATTLAKLQQIAGRSGMSSQDFLDLASRYDLSDPQQMAQVMRMVDPSLRGPTGFPAMPMGEMPGQIPMESVIPSRGTEVQALGPGGTSLELAPTSLRQLTPAAQELLQRIDNGAPVPPMSRELRDLAEANGVRVPLLSNTQAALGPEDVVSQLRAIQGQPYGYGAIDAQQAAAARGERAANVAQGFQQMQQRLQQTGLAAAPGEAVQTGRRVPGILTREGQLITPAEPLPEGSPAGSRWFQEGLAPASSGGTVSMSQRVRQLWLFNAISGASGVVRAAASGVLAPAFRLPIGLAQDVILNQDLSRAQGRLIGYWAGMAESGPRMLKGLLDVYNDPARMAAMATNPADRIMGLITQTPNAIHAASKSFGTPPLARQEMTAMAYGEAAARGFKGDALGAEAQKILQNPPPGWQDTANGVANRLLGGELGTFGQFLENLLRRAPLGVGDIVAPVFRLPYSLAAAKVTMSPLGALGTGYDVARGLTGFAGGGPYVLRDAEGNLLRNATRSEIGQALLPRQFGQPSALNPFAHPSSSAVWNLQDRLTMNLIGTAATVALVSKALDGTLSGAGPSDPDQRRMLMASGWRPYSVHVGQNTWVPYDSLPMVSLDLALAGDYADAVNGAPPQEAIDVAAGRRAGFPGPVGQGHPQPAADAVAQRLFTQVGNHLVSETGLSGLTDLLDLLQNGSDLTVSALSARFGQDYVANVVPGAGALRTIAQATDPYARQVQTGPYVSPLTSFAQSLEQDLPGLRGNVPTQLGPLGEPLPNTAQGLAGLIPGHPGVPSSGAPIEANLAAIGETVGGAPPAIAYGQGREIQLTPPEQRFYEQAKGDMITQILGPMLQNGQWQQVDPQARPEFWKSVEDSADRYAQGMTLSAMNPTQAYTRSQPRAGSYLSPVVSYAPNALAQQYLGQSMLQQAMQSHQRAMAAIQAQASPVSMPSLLQNVPALA